MEVVTTCLAFVACTCEGPLKRVGRKLKQKESTDNNK